MTIPLPYSHPALRPDPDHSGRLLAAGITLLICGLMTTCTTAMLPVALFLPKQPGQPEIPVTQIVVSFVIYAGISALMVSLGIGAIRKRRWCRPLTLIFATHWLILGILSLLSMAMMFPMLRDSIEQNSGAGLPPGFGAVVAVISIGFIVVFTIALPSVILALMKSDGTRTTLEFYDQPRWTDHCPIRILGCALTLVIAGVLCFTMIPYAILPVLGKLFVGPGAIVGLIGIGGALVAAGVLVYRLSMAGWWLGLLSIVVPALASVPTNLNVSLVEIYRAIGTPEEQILAVLPHERLMRIMMVSFPILLAITFAIYMIQLLPAFKAARAHRQ